MSDNFRPYFKATTTKKNGVITWKWEPGEEENFKRYLNGLQFKEATAKIKISVERYRNDASTQQMRYLFGVVYAIIGDAFGYDVYEYYNEIHVPLKKMFLGFRHVKQRADYKILKQPLFTKETVAVEVVSLKEIDTKQMTDYIENVRRWALKEHNLIIPAPNEVDMEKLPDQLPDF